MGNILNRADLLAYNNPNNIPALHTYDINFEDRDECARMLTLLNMIPETTRC